MSTTQEAPAAARQITDNVRQMYRRHPFPTSQRKHGYRKHAAFVRRFLESCGIDPAGRTFGDIACGTGLMMLDYAKEFPDTTFIGYDLSDVSVESANATLEADKVNNARCEVADIMQLDLQNELDYILSWGTIHHLTEPRLGLKILCRALKPGGILRTGIYGFYGNWERRVQQQLIRSLTYDLDLLDFDAKIEAVRDWAKGDRNFKNYYTAPPIDLDDDDWVVDEFLHVWENHLRLSELAEWLEEEDMEVLALTDYYDNEISLDIAAHSTSQSFISRVRELPVVAQYEIIEGLVRPYWLSLLVQKRA